MSRNLTAKIILIIVLIAVGAWTLYPPSQKLKPGTDLGGGTNLIYEIDTHGLKESDKKDLAARMITVLRRRIDPANIQNLIWRPLGNNRFEIQMPLASAEARQRRNEYKAAEETLLNKNLSPARILRSLEQPPDKRAEAFKTFAQDDPNRVEILENLAAVHDEHKELKNKRDELHRELETSENAISSAASLDLDQVKSNRNDWAKLNTEELDKALREVTDVNDSIALLTGYVKTYSEWSRVVDELLAKQIQYKDARGMIDRLNLSRDQLNVVLEASKDRAKQIEKLKADFPDRVSEIDDVVAAYDRYEPYKGRLDDPMQLKRMLQGAGVLEFRILPTQDDSEADELRATYVTRLEEKGPQYASDGTYEWFEIENAEEWNAPKTIIAPFGGKFYVLAAGDDQKDETMLQGPLEKPWKLVKANPTTDDMGRRAIGFLLDEKGGSLFQNITGKNMGRPLCILLDDIAISAPNIEARIRRQGVITGSFSQTEVDDMVNKLNAGSLPARLIPQPIAENTIGPSIGADNRDQGIRAGLIGLIAVMACMLVYYMLAGSIADVALLMNILFVLAIMAGVRATFTLPGIAGIILTIGMSVDANVLIFERIREEQQRGSSLRIAVTNGYQKAFRTIFDANLTTFITAAILYWRASEEVKGFAIVLMLGIASSMFTALFVTRVVFDLILFSKPTLREMKLTVLATWPLWGLGNYFGGGVCFPFLPFRFAYLLNLFLSSVLVGFVIAFVTTLAIYTVGYLGMLARQRGILKDRLFMLRLIHKPNVDWMRSRPIFVGLSAVLIIGGLLVFYTRDDTKNNKYDEEFTGGFTAQINLKEPMTRQEVEDKIRAIGDDPNNPNPALKTANVYSIGESGKQYEISTTETNRQVVDVTFSQGAPSVEEAIGAIQKAQAKFAGTLSNLRVQPSAADGGRLTISTSQMNQSLVRDVLKDAFGQATISEPRVDEVVNNAILAAFADQLEIQQDLQPNITSMEKISEDLITSYPELIDFLGGIRIQCELGQPTTAGEIEQRFKDLAFQPDMEDLESYAFRILDVELNEMTDPNQSVKSFVYVSAEADAGFREPTEDQWNRFVANEEAKVMAATKMASSLPRVRQFDPAVGDEQKTRALIAIILSLFAIVTYIWIRFGDVRYGIAAITALVHDVCITLGAVTACTYIAGTSIGELLLIGDFKINLAMIAAFLTLIGYSLNDTIVVFDRIRENRGKARTLNPQVITNSINQTISRTLLTSFTTFIVVLIMYIFGGSGLRGFTFAIGLGIIVGTYSSIAIAAPILLIGKKTNNVKGKK
ncbi:MAG: protein translocase subunit SecD [Phycisphaerales bacterium]|nr:MAG: protein translocase subunit SecD [Phycisphaerales bacterium]